jgi:multidrug efflux system membrane fusion protein
VTSGLKLGDKVITEGGDRLTEGGKVQLPGQAAPRTGKGKRPEGGQQRRRPE